MTRLMDVQLMGEAPAVRLFFDGSEPVDISLVWLRDNCASGFHPQTNERIFDLLAVPDVPSVTECRLDEQSLHIVWAHDGASSRFDARWLWANRPGLPRQDPADVALRLWRADDMPEGPSRHSADEILGDDESLMRWLLAIAQDGLAVVDGIVGDGAASVALAERVGFLRRTNFGLTFEVVQMPEPNNLAYTSMALPLHTDLPNQEMPPGVQFLQCITNEADGGDSVFADGFAIVDALREDDPDAFATLSRVSVPYRFFDRDHDIRIRRPVITLDPDGRITDLRFNAHIADVIDLDVDVVDRWYRAYRSLMRLTRSPDYRLGYRLESGEMVAFDNRRVLHGRTEFDPSTGRRHLHGCYVDRGEFESRIRVLHGANTL